MAGPITWRNVSGGGDLGAASLTSSGGASVLQGLKALQDVASQQQALNIQNQKAIRENNTQDYLDQVASVTDAAVLADPAKQAELEQTRLSYGNMIDRAATRTAQAAQLANLQRQDVAAGAYADDQLERTQRPLIEELYQAARDKDKTKVNTLLGENNFLNEGKVAKDIDSIFDAQTNREYAAAGQARAERSEVRQAAQFKESMAAAAENRADRKEERAMRRGVLAIDATQKELDTLQKAALASNPGGAPSTDIAKDTSIITQKIIGAVDPWLRRNNPSRVETQNTIRSLMADGIEVPLGDGTTQRIKITPAQLQQYADVHGDDTNIWWGPGGKNGDIADYFKDMYTNDPSLVAKSVQAAAAQNKLREMAKSLNEEKRKLLTGSGGIDFDSLSGTLRSSALPRPGQNLLPGRDEDEKFK